MKGSSSLHNRLCGELSCHYFLHPLGESYIIHWFLLGNQYINKQPAHYTTVIICAKPQNVTFVIFSITENIPLYTSIFLHIIVWNLHYVSYTVWCDQICHFFLQKYLPWIHHSLSIRIACRCKIQWQTWRVDFWYISDYVISFHVIPVVNFLHSLCKSYILHWHLLDNQYINQQPAQYTIGMIRAKPQNVTFVICSIIENNPLFTSIFYHIIVQHLYYVSYTVWSDRH